MNFARSTSHMSTDSEREEKRRSTSVLDRTKSDKTEVQYSKLIQELIAESVEVVLWLIMVDSHSAWL